MLKKSWLHFKLITKHKWIVFKLCCKVGLPWRGLIHDLSKYSITEFWESAKFYVGYKSPIQVAREKRLYSAAWLHHKGRNKHHYEYWLDYGFPPDRRITGMKMPKKYVVEMFMDRIAACKVYMKESGYHDAAPWEYYDKSKSILLMHDETRALLEEMLMMLAEKGEKETFAYVKKEILRK